MRRLTVTRPRPQSPRMLRVRSRGNLGPPERVALSYNPNDPS